jgi:hypothetical protein
MASSILHTRPERIETRRGETARRTRRQRCADGEEPRGTSRGPNHERGEPGAVLILVLVFMIITTVLIGSVASWAINDLGNVASFRNVTQRLYAAGGATEVAIRAARYSYPPTMNATSSTTVGYVCPPLSTPILINTFYIQDWCVETANLGPVSREVVLTACLMPTPTSTLTGPCLINGNTQSNGNSVPTVLTATVDFYDRPANANSNPDKLYCTATDMSSCGLGMAIKSWIAH